LHLTAAHLIEAYAMGVFPMAEGRDDPNIHWVDPRERGIIPLDGFHVSRSLARRIRQWDHRVTIDTAFDAVVAACADREVTWINGSIFDLYRQLHGMNVAHSLELWEEDVLVGGVYGVVLGAAFFGESMFSRRTDASKVALAYLVHRLRAGVTPHLATLGAIEISRAEYRQRLQAARALNAQFAPPDYSPSTGASSSAG
jgi:leucyl/phenylalanyl-tRNA---protein transferase